MVGGVLGGSEEGAGIWDVAVFYALWEVKRTSIGRGKDPIGKSLVRSVCSHPVL